MWISRYPAAKRCGVRVGVALGSGPSRNGCGERDPSSACGGVGDVTEGDACNIGTSTAGGDKPPASQHMYARTVFGRHTTHSNALFIYIYA